jgi:uncharacterized protein YbgA (DUF1722 family)
MNEKHYLCEDIVNLEKIPHSILTEDAIVSYTHHTFKNLKKDATKNKLVLFHTHNKFLLMCHNQDKLRILGNIVANHKKNSLSEILEEYEIHLRDTLTDPPTTTRHINTLMHVFGHFSKDINKIQKELFLNLLDQLRDGSMTLGTVLWEIEPLIYQYNKTYLTGQTYFSLYAEKRPVNSAFLKSFINITK